MSGYSFFVGIIHGPVSDQPAEPYTGSATHCDQCDYYQLFCAWPIRGDGRRLCPSCVAALGVEMPK